MAWLTKSRFLSGRKSFQICVSIIYKGNLRSFATATYQSTGAAQSVPVTTLSSELTNCAVGDILFEFDGHPINTSADLEAAVAACAAKSTVVIKLFRGTDAMSLTAQF